MRGDGKVADKGGFWELSEGSRGEYGGTEAGAVTSSYGRESKFVLL